MPGGAAKCLFAAPSGESDDGRDERWLPFPGALPMRHFSREFSPPLEGEFALFRVFIWHRLESAFIRA
jgi:hypothetical protein